MSKKRKTYTAEQLELIVKLRKQGLTYEKIVEKTNFGIDIIRRTCRLAKLGTVPHKQKKYKKPTPEVYAFGTYKTKRKEKIYNVLKYAKSNILTKYFEDDICFNTISRTYTAIPKFKKKGAK